jgi:DNA-binding response OmpR family regulator
VLCVDNDRAILDGMEALLAQWGVQVLKARNSAEATLLCTQSGIDTILADYHLGDGVNGIELLRRLCKSRTPAVAAALISADHDADLVLAARNAGFPLLHKPLRPAALRALLCTFRLRARNASAA